MTPRTHCPTASRVLTLRRLSRSHHGILSLALLILLALRLVMPTGWMPVVSDGAITVSLCSSGSAVPQTVTIAIPKADAGKTAPSDHATSGEACLFSGVAAAAIGGADPFQLASALAFVMLQGTRALHGLAPLATPYLRPPLRAPPFAF